MQYLKLKEQLKDFIVFSIGEIQKIYPAFHKQRLSEWQKKGYLKKIINEYYIFSDLDINESALFVIANNIYQPSYISLETALSHYHLIPESVYAITSTTSRITRNFNTKVAQFIFRKIKPELMFGYKLIRYKNQNFKIAEIEKAILDYFYINAGLKKDSDFQGLRINSRSFKEQVDMKKFANYLKQFHNKALKKRVNKFLEFQLHA